MCVEGDVSFHIKRKKQRDEHFPEKLILNWFLQCALALKYIHENKILHRDIKSSNIFVTSNGFVKIGDFGISRVLEHTYDSASTVVGTPYYMRYQIDHIFIAQKFVKINPTHSRAMYGH